MTDPDGQHDDGRDEDYDGYAAEDHDGRARDDDDRDDDGGDDRPRNGSRSQGRALRRERQRVASLQRELAELKGRPADDPKSGPKSESQDIEAMARRIREEVAAEYEAKSNGILLSTDAADALREAGYRGNPRRGVRQLDLEGVTVANGRVDREALADAIEELKEDSPELFRRARRQAEADDEELDRDGDRPARRARPRETGGPRQRSGNGQAEDPMLSSFRAISGSGRR